VCPISPEEVEKAFFDMLKGESLGPNGFTSDFFQACWPIIKWDTWALVEDSHLHSNFIPDLNITFLTFIPKEDKVENPNKFFLISLCNMVYRIITKVIANRLKFLLPSLISLKQTSYVEGRQILDWVILSTWSSTL
jgi:hypothetical protein